MQVNEDGKSGIINQEIHAAWLTNIDYYQVADFVN